MLTFSGQFSRPLDRDFMSVDVFVQKVDSKYRATGHGNGYVVGDGYDFVLGAYGVLMLGIDPHQIVHGLGKEFL